THGTSPRSDAKPAALESGREPGDRLVSGPAGRAGRQIEANIVDPCRPDCGAEAAASASWKTDRTSHPADAGRQGLGLVSRPSNRSDLPQQSSCECPAGAVGDRRRAVGAEPSGT